MSMFGLAALGIGSSLIGGIMGSSSASKAAAAEQAAAREAQQLKVDKDAESQFMADLAYYGKDAAIQRLKTRYGENAVKYLGEKAADPTFNDQQRSRVAELDQIIAGGGAVDAGGGGLPWSNANKNQNSAAAKAERLKSAKAERDALVKAAGGRVGTTGLLNTDSIDGNQVGFIEQLRQLSGRRTSANQSLLADAQGIEDGLAAYGKQEEERIRRDTDRQAQGLARVSRASMMGRGLGAGTAFTDVVERGNRSLLESQNDQLGQLADKRIQMQTAAKGDTLNLRKSLLADQFQYESQPINAEMGYATSGIQNPWLGVDTRQYVSSASPSAASGATWGNLFAGIGGQMSSLAMMQGMGGNNGSGAAGGSGQGGTVNGVYYPSNFVGPTPRPN